MVVPLFINPVILAVLVLIIFKNKALRQQNVCGSFYTALGDSIAYGLGAPNGYGYTCQLRNFLYKRYPNMIFKNLSRPGATSSDLLLKLKLNSRFRYAVKNAGLITISIGGNNLLRSSRQNYTVVNPHLAQLGVNRFASDWPAILNCIRCNIGSKAPILIPTLYNPYRYDEPLYGTANCYINQINEIIKNETLQAAYGYFVIDVYEHFEQNFSKDWIHFNQYRRNPHPNFEGHSQIYLLHRNIFGI